MEIIENQALCVDCLFAAVNGDRPDDPAAAAAVEQGLRCSGGDRTDCNLIIRSQPARSHNGPIPFWAL